MKEVCNKDKIILDLCGGTGSWSLPYKKAGYDVRVVTLPENDVLTYQPPVNVYGILAAPPCTEFSLAKGNRPRDFESAIQVVNACLKIIWHCRINGHLKFWVLENPRGFLRQFLGIPYYTFFHWQFGEIRSKPTDIWGYFNKPKPTCNELPKLLRDSAFPNGTTHGRAWSKPKNKDYEHLNLSRAALRAITPAGFAKAFFKANK